MAATRVVRPPYYIFLSSCVSIINHFQSAYASYMVHTQSESLKIGAASLMIDPYNVGVFGAPNYDII